jgi:hypothetical protein
MTIACLFSFFLKAIGISQIRAWNKVEYCKYNLIDIVVKVRILAILKSAHSQILKFLRSL